MQAPQEYEPLLKLFFTLSYVLLAAFVGAFADSMPKWRVMLINNTIKIFRLLDDVFRRPSAGCLRHCRPRCRRLLARQVRHSHRVPAPSPACRGERLDRKTTVGAIILGTLVGGMLIKPSISQALLGFDFR